MKKYMLYFLTLVLLFLESTNSLSQFRGSRRMSGFGNSRSSGWGKIYKSPIPVRSSRFNNSFSTNSKSLFTPSRKKTYALYKKMHTNGNSYFGRTSGYGDPKMIVKKRDSRHHKKDYSEARLIRSSNDKNAIRGLEDIMISKNRDRGKSGNSIAGISNRNKKKQSYWDAARNSFRLPKSW
jgi:hypothetical protein